VRDAGNLLTRAGLAIPAVDVDEVQVQYGDAAQLVEHLRCVVACCCLLLSSGVTGKSGTVGRGGQWSCRADSGS
jgi:NADH dehydrogenase [ubiquinone] 1 alpha subcomplex assembly factor 5